MADKEKTPVILSGVRTPIGRFLGGLSTLPATELGALTVQEAVKRARREAPPPPRYASEREGASDG